MRLRPNLVHLPPFTYPLCASFRGLSFHRRIGRYWPRDWATLIRMTRSSIMIGDNDTPQQKYFIRSLASAVAPGNP